MKSSPTTRHTNRLANEKSPYLLQHADNPVDWYPWSEEAFTTAKKRDVPIFLSIGYSTCHWCHVMERESFEDEEVAKILNDHYVSIKVDREERPDIDNVYMAVCQALTGSGGWPLTIIMTPDKKPFFAGTYFPKETLHGRPGLVDILTGISKLWKDDRARVLESGEEITAAIQARVSRAAGAVLSEATLRKAHDLFSQKFDKKYGGFGNAPKFPTPHNISFLLRWWKRSGDKQALAMAEKTLDEMSRGGMYDHVGFGFHRYSTDARWLTPHFEKMLYDQALLAVAYLEAYQATGKKQYAKVSRQIFSYILRDMTASEGGFYSAEDADSEGEEGKFYVWTPSEIAEVLGKDDGNLFSRFYGVTKKGNFEHNKSIVHVKTSIDDFAEKEGLSAKDVRSRLEKARVKLFAAREQRIHPHKDDKILTDWNGLMIAAFAKGAQVLDEKEYADAARRAADFILTKMRDKNDALLHRYRDGDASVHAFVDDYAFLVWGLIELYEATFDVRYLKEALALNNSMLDLFWDKEGGGLLFTSNKGEELIVQTKEIYDGAVPSGNSVAAGNILRLGRMTANQKLEKTAEQLMAAFAGDVERYPPAYTQFLIAVDFAIGPTKEIVIAGESGSRDTEEMLRELRRHFLPRAVVLLHPTGEAGEEIEKLAEFIKAQKTRDGKATAYVCENYACKLPTTDPKKMTNLLISK